MAFVATVFAAILAGRSRPMWQLLFFDASAPIALTAALITGIGLAVLTVIADLRSIRAGYSIFGHRDQYSVDLGNSLWFRRTATWRPKEFRQS